MRTLLSQDATARCSEVLEKHRSWILSSGGVERGKSLEISPWVAGAALLVAALPPKSPAIFLLFF